MSTGGYTPRKSAKGIWIRLLWERENSWPSLPARGSLVAFKRTTWLSSEIKREFKRGDVPSETTGSWFVLERKILRPVLSLRCVLSVSWCWIALFACCSVSCLRFVLLSYVSQWRWREQRSWRHSELGVANRSEGDIMKKGWCCFDWTWCCWTWFELVCWCLDVCVLVFCFGVYPCTCVSISLSWHMMRTWEETQTESESN